MRTHVPDPEFERRYTRLDSLKRVAENYIISQIAHPETLNPKEDILEVSVWAEEIDYALELGRKAQDFTDSLHIKPILH